MYMLEFKCIHLRLPSLYNVSMFSFLLRQGVGYSDHMSPMVLTKFSTLTGTPKQYLDFTLYLPTMYNTWGLTFWEVA